MAEALVLKTNHSPSYFNKDMLLGGLLATLTPVGLVASGGAELALWAGAIAAGSLIGGAVGKASQEKENHEGKKVEKPSFWNKDTLIGGLLGLIIGGGAFLATSLAVLGTAVLTAPLAPEAVGAAALGGLMLAAAGVIVAPFVGTYLGGRHGERQMEREREEAQLQQMHAQSVSKERAPMPQFDHDLGHGKNHAQSVLEERAHSQNHQRNR